MFYCSQKKESLKMKKTIMLTCASFALLIALNSAQAKDQAAARVLKANELGSLHDSKLIDSVNMGRPDTTTENALLVSSANSMSGLKAISKRSIKDSQIIPDLLGKCESEPQFRESTLYNIVKTKDQDFIRRIMMYKDDPKYTRTFFMLNQLLSQNS